MSGIVAARTVRIADLQVMRVSARGDRREPHHFSVSVTAAMGAGAPALDAVRLADAVRALARDSAGAGHEAYAYDIARHLAQRLPGVVAVRAEVSGVAWSRIEIGGRPRDRDFTLSPSGARLARVEISAGAEYLHAGVRDVKLLTVQHDGPVTVGLDALWSYGWSDVPYDTQWQQVLRALVEAFTERQVDAGDDLAHALATAVLEQSPAVREIEVALRVGALEPVDLTPFGMDTTHEVVSGSPTLRAGYSISLVRPEVEE